MEEDILTMVTIVYHPAGFGFHVLYPERPYTENDTQVQHELALDQTDHTQDQVLKS